MSLHEELKQFLEEEYVFEFPDGEKLTLRPVRAIEIIPRLGVAPSAVASFIGAAEGGQVEPEHIPEAAVLASRLEEAYFVYGIVGVKLCFTHEAAEGKCEGVPVQAFRDFVRKKYGPEVLKALEKKLRQVSGEIAPEEVAQDRESFRAVAEGPALHGEGLRDEPDRVSDPAAG